MWNYKKTAHILHPITEWRKPLCARERLLFRQMIESVWENTASKVKTWFDATVSTFWMIPTVTLSVIKSTTVIKIYAELDCSKTIVLLPTMKIWKATSSTSLPNYKGTGPPARRILSMSSTGNNNNNNNNSNNNNNNYYY